MEHYLRPPTKRMIEKLTECWEKESANNSSIPCLPEDMKSSLAGLYKRGFVGTRMELINGKRKMSIYVTEAGKKFLEEYNNRKK